MRKKLKVEKATKLAALIKAIGIAGGNFELSRKLGRDETIVSTWLQRGQVSHKEAIKVEEITGVSRYELRPDVFGEAPKTRHDIDNETRALT